jgi:hypothetical protein
VEFELFESVEFEDITSIAEEAPPESFCFFVLGMGTARTLFIDKIARITAVKMCVEVRMPDNERMYI